MSERLPHTSLFRLRPCILMAYLLLCQWMAFGQNETNHWHFGSYAGLDFSNGDFAVDNTGAMDTPAGCSAISDQDGQLMLYTNGETVWNRNHEVMENGLDLFTDKDGVQTCAIVPNPVNTNLYYIFHGRQTASVDPFIQKGLYYSIVDFTANPLGSVTLKNVRLRDNTTARITSTFDYATNTFKVFTIGAAGGSSVNNTLFIWTVGADGIPDEPDPQLLTFEYDFSATGQMKISPDQTMLAVANSDDSKVYLFHLNIAAPSVSFYNHFMTQEGPGNYPPYGVEFSQDSYWLYVGCYGRLYQYEIDPPPYPYEAERKIVASTYNSLQLARNGKIYCTNVPPDPREKKIGVINFPERPFELLEFGLVDISESSPTRGLPNIPSALLQSQIITTYNCFGEIHNFSLESFRPIDAIQWDFGDGTTSTEMEPQHLFTTPGIHKVSATIAGRNDYPVTIYEDVYAYHLPYVVPGTVLTQCDLDNDGVERFNLRNLELKMPQPEGIRYEYDFTFYHTLEDAQADTNAITGSGNYENTANPEKIFVRIVNQYGCTSIADFDILAEYHPLPPMTPYVVCEPSDGVPDNSRGRFWLGDQEEEIRAQLGLSDTETIQLYPTQANALAKTYEIILGEFPNSQYDSQTTTIWIRVEDATNDCKGITAWELIVNPMVTSIVPGVVSLCAGEPVHLEGNPENTSWKWERITGGAVVIGTDREITISEPGYYRITEYYTANGVTCSFVRPFIVNESGTVSFTTLQAGNGEIYVSVSGYSTYEFSVDGVHYFGNALTHTFTNLASGIYTVYVKDVNDCEDPIQKDVILIRFDSYFTPNDDGYNDTWTIKELKPFYPTYVVDIYDRYGTLLYTFTDSDELGWDGTLRGKNLPATDYWFRANMTDTEGNTEIHRGHFALKR